MIYVISINPPKKLQTFDPCACAGVVSPAQVAIDVGGAAPPPPPAPAPPAPMAPPPLPTPPGPAEGGEAAAAHVEVEGDAPAAPAQASHMCRAIETVAGMLHSGAPAPFREQAPVGAHPLTGLGSADLIKFLVPWLGFPGVPVRVPPPWLANFCRMCSFDSPASFRALYGAGSAFKTSCCCA
jgi:hypothetical protein